MNFGFEIVEVKLGSSASVYTILIDGQSTTELDSFLEKVERYIREIEDPEKGEALKEAFDFIVRRLNMTIPSKGARSHYFDYDGRADDAVEKIKQSLLRLYCLRYGKLLIILGNGGIKPVSVRKTQDKEDLDEAVRKLQYINERINKEQQAGRFRFDDQGRITESSTKKFEEI